MKYNAKYDRWVSKDGLVYRYDEKNDRLVLCTETLINSGYISLYTKAGNVLQHRVVYETFVGEIPAGYDIDHINTIKTDNRVENLRCVTRSGNMLNPLTRKRNSEAQMNKVLSEETRNKISNSMKKPKSDFGEKFFEHYGFTKRGGDINLYNRELYWYRRHNKVCRWEVEDKCK